MQYIRKFWPVYLVAACLFLGIVAAGQQTVTVIAQNQPIERKPVFIIDAGHGGEDGGAVSCTGVLESRINLEIALRLQPLLQFLGYPTAMIRTEDVAIHTEGSTIGARKVSDLKNRVKFVNEREEGILLSIHQNTFPQEKYSGAQIFYNDEQGRALAQSLQEAFCKTVNPGSSRKAKKAQGVYLMEHIENPGLLIECGFLSNPSEEAKLRSGEYQKKICCVIACSLSQMLSNT